MQDSTENLGPSQTERDAQFSATQQATDPKPFTAAENAATTHGNEPAHDENGPVPTDRDKAVVAPRSHPVTGQPLAGTLIPDDADVDEGTPTSPPVTDQT